MKPAIILPLMLSATLGPSALRAQDPPRYLPTGLFIAAIIVFTRGAPPE